MIGYSVPDRVGVVRAGDEVYVARLPDGPILRLTGTAAIIWNAAVDASAGSPLDQVAETVGLSAARIADDVERFLGSLVDRGMLSSQAAERY